MDKLNRLVRNIVLGVLLGSLTLLMATNTYIFTCLCAVELSVAFGNIDKHIIDDNLIPMKNNLKESNKKVTENIDALRENNLLLDKKLKIYTKQYMQLQELLNKSKIELKTVSNHSEI
jgi:hypothetical protein